MAMGSGSVSNRSVSGKKERVKSSQKKESKLQVNAVSTSPAKRNKSPGIRVVGGRIYDSVNGKTCHLVSSLFSFYAIDARLANAVLASLLYSYYHFQLRYGEKAEEVAALGEWSCPKCRGICNCSVCMKKRGHQPTGILINTAKATGFSSVSEMLLNEAERLNHEKVVADSPKKGVVHSPRNLGKENSFDGKVDVNLPNHIEKKSKKVKEVQKGNKKDNTSLNIISPSPGKRKSKQEGLEDVHEGTKKLGTKETGSRGSEKKTEKKKRDRSDEMSTRKNDEEIAKESSVHDDEKKPKKSRKDKLENDDSKKNDATLARRTSPRKLKLSNNKPTEVAKLNIGVDPDKNLNNKINSEKHSVEPLGNVKRKEENELNSVAGIDVCTEEVGNALQFLEFCTVFGKASDFIYNVTANVLLFLLASIPYNIALYEILEMKKGQPEHVLQDLLHGRSGRRGKFSLTVQFHIHLLSILQSELGDECATLSPSSWFHALKECLSESQNVLKAQGLESLDKAADYETLEASEKLRLLNLLCDEVLGTEKVRNWMDDQNTKHAEKVKEAKRNVLAAKDKEKSLKQKMKDDIAKAIIARHGALSISEHDSIVSNIKRKAAQAHAEVLESKGLILKSNQISDAVRIEPIFVGVGGHAYWKLKCFSKSDILRQDAGKGDNLTLDDKWFIIDDEGKEVIDKHISSSR
ncbi:hypothetical protein DH2020_037739 [Rehmannia glutinosa]|uniref:Zinc-finger domain-containing protein n=1 Tax=Rehmannia glutinosa TaxID=99300 RepID=A0ABR0V3B4_REHGL